MERLCVSTIKFRVGGKWNNKKYESEDRKGRCERHRGGIHDLVNMSQEHAEQQNHMDKDRGKEHHKKPASAVFLLMQLDSTEQGEETSLMKYCKGGGIYMKR